MKTNRNTLALKALGPAISILILTSFIEAQEADHLSENEVQAALQLSPKKHHTDLIDMQTVFANTGSGHGAQIPKILIYMPDAWIAKQRDNATREYRKYEPGPDDRLRAMTIIADGVAMGGSAGPTCDSVVRIALISDKSGQVVIEAAKQGSYDATWQNGFGASATCSSVEAKFMLTDVSKIQTAADKGQFIVGVFYSDSSSKLYKLKPIYLKDLGLMGNGGSNEPHR